MIPQQPKSKAPIVLKQTGHVGGNSYFDPAQSSSAIDVQFDRMGSKGPDASEKMGISGDSCKRKDKENGVFGAVQKAMLKRNVLLICFCKICESDEHVAAKCPTKNRQRPMAYAVGYAVDDLGNMALIKVFGGQLNEVELMGHLKRRAPENFEWDVQLQAPDT